MLSVTVQTSNVICWSGNYCGARKSTQTYCCIQNSVPIILTVSVYQELRAQQAGLVCSSVPRQRRGLCWDSLGLTQGPGGQNHPGPLHPNIWQSDLNSDRLGYLGLLHTCGVSRWWELFKLAGWDTRANILKEVSIYPRPKLTCTRNHPVSPRPLQNHREGTRLCLGMGNSKITHRFWHTVTTKGMVYHVGEQVKSSIGSEGWLGLKEVISAAKSQARPIQTWHAMTKWLICCWWLRGTNCPLKGRFGEANCHRHRITWGGWKCEVA